MTRLNYTGRRRIAREDVKLAVRTIGGQSLLDVHSIDVASLGLPLSARVIIEAYRQTAYMRIDAGTVGLLQLPTGVALNEFRSSDGVLFRIKVVGSDPEDVGKLLAVADRIPARLDETGGQSLLPILPESMGHELWRIDFTDDEPVLLVNSDVGDWKGFAAKPIFQALVLPEAARQVARWVLDAGLTDVTDLESAAAQWARLMINWGYNPMTVTVDQRVEWINDFVQMFCRRFNFREMIPELIGEAE